MRLFSRLSACARPCLSKNSLTKSILRLTAGAAFCCALFVMPQQALAINDDAVLKKMDSVLEENARLREYNAWLQQQLAAARKKSSTSSKPPSSDMVKPPKLASWEGKIWISSSKDKVNVTMEDGILGSGDRGA